MKLMQELLEETKKRHTAKEKAQANALMAEHAETLLHHQQRIAVLEMMLKVEKAAATGAEKAIMPLVSEFGKGKVILENVSLNIKDMGYTSPSPKYKSVAEGLVEKLREFDDNADEIFGALVTEYTGKANKRADKLEVDSTVMGNFLDDLSQITGSEALDRVGKLEKYPDLIRKSKARKAKVEEGVMSDLRAKAKEFISGIKSFVKGLLPKAKETTALAKEIKRLSAQLK